MPCGTHNSSEVLERLMRFHGEKINFPQRQTYCPNEYYTRWYFREVFEGD